MREDTDQNEVCNKAVFSKATSSIQVKAVFLTSPGPLEYLC